MRGFPLRRYRRNLGLWSVQCPTAVRADPESQRVVTEPRNLLPSLCWGHCPLLTAGCGGSGTQDLGEGWLAQGRRVETQEAPDSNSPTVQARSCHTLTGQRGGCFQSKQNSGRRCRYKGRVFPAGGDIKGSAVPDTRLTPLYP